MSRRLPVAVLLAVLAAVVVAAPAAGAARKAVRRAVAKVALTQLRASGQRVTIAGRVTLPRGSASQRTRARTRVAFTLTDAKRKRERFSVKIDAQRAFKLRRATKLSGRLTLAARVTIGGRQSGKTVSRTLTVKAASRRAGGSGGGGTTTPGGGTTTPGGGGGGGTTPPGGESPADQGTPLVGLLKLDEGRQSASGRLSGTYFQMTGIINGDSPFADKRYTPLSPGTDGGLRTDVYQEPPVPAFAGPWDETSQLLRGDALGKRIVQPQKFFSLKFTIVTAPTDLQTGTPDPLPEIRYKDGRLSGQITAWTAQWNGNSFNQGAPKPDGSYPADSGNLEARTTPLTGTYDPGTRRFTLRWTSLIVGGPFDHYGGIWNLEGTFVPS